MIYLIPRLFSDDHNLLCEWHTHTVRVVCVCVCVCVVIPFILDVRLVDVPAGVTQEEGYTGFLIHLPFVPT